MSYPVPARYAGNYVGLPMDPPTLANLLVPRPKGFKCGQPGCSYCDTDYDWELDHEYSD